MKPRIKILYVYDTPVNVDVVLQWLQEQRNWQDSDRILRVNNQAIPKEKSGLETQLFGSPFTSEPSKSWIHETS